MDFFTHLSRRFPYLPIIAEDLGLITQDVKDVMHHFGFPGMKILLFAFGPDMPHNPYIPRNFPKNCVAYTGTHDNNTVKGWFDQDASQDDKQRLFRYLGREVSADEVPWELIRLLMMSAADTVILPLQDVLGLGPDARMNTPATTRVQLGLALQARPANSRCCQQTTRDHRDARPLAPPIREVRSSRSATPEWTGVMVSP